MYFDFFVELLKFIINFLIFDVFIGLSMSFLVVVIWIFIVYCDVLIWGIGKFYGRIYWVCWEI